MGGFHTFQFAGTAGSHFTGAQALIALDALTCALEIGHAAATVIVVLRDACFLWGV